jgi:hypothetical protein
MNPDLMLIAQENAAKVQMYWSAYMLLFGSSLVVVFAFMRRAENPRRGKSSV